MLDAVDHGMPCQSEQRNRLPFGFQVLLSVEDTHSVFRSSDPGLKRSDARIVPIRKRLLSDTLYCYTLSECSVISTVERVIWHSQVPIRYPNIHTGFGITTGIMLSTCFSQSITWFIRI